MIKTSINITNQLGLHARASAKFVACASKFISQIKVSRGSKTVNGKSIMGVMMLAASKGSELILEIEGEDEQAMEKALTALIQNNFGESE